MTRYDPSDFRAVALDVDGTLTDHTHQVRPRAIEAIRWLESRDIPVIILTGRRSNLVLDLARECGISRPMVSDNGSVILDTGTGEIIEQRFAPPEMRDVIFDIAERFDLGRAVWAPDGIYADDLNRYTDILGEMAGEDVRVADLMDLPTDRVYKYNLYGSEERLDEVQPYIEANHPEVRRSAIIFFETATPGATKWEGLLHCLEHVGIDPHEVVGIADGENDLDFIEGVGLGVAVANAFPRLKELADIEIGPADEDGTAIFLEDFFGRHAAS
jgi:Cof subfamily protein (haloacid dehalogenase superfamily)